MRNLIQIHSRIKGTTSSAMLLLSLSCCRDTNCREGGCRVRGRTFRTLSFVNSGEVASGEICFWYSALLMFLLLITSASDDVSSGALLQTRFFRRSTSDAVLQTQSSRCFKLQVNSFALELVQSESLRIVLWLWILHTWTNCLAYQLIIFNTLLLSKLNRWLVKHPCSNILLLFLILQV